MIKHQYFLACVIQCCDVSYFLFRITFYHIAAASEVYCGYNPCSRFSDSCIFMQTGVPKKSVAEVGSISNIVKDSPHKV